MGRASRRKRLVKEGGSEAKLSERLIQLIAPLREHRMKKGDYDGLLKFAALAWNLSLLPEETRGETFDRALQEQDISPALRPSMRADFVALVEQKTALFPDDRRLIVDVYVTDLGDGRLNVVVASES